MSRETLEALRRKFRERFGRDPGPDDPVFFDPSAEEPRTLDEDGEALFIAMSEMAMLPPRRSDVREPVRRNRGDVSERGWVSIENGIEVSRSPEDVFDYLTDITREVEWNPRTRRAEKLTSGPIGPGTRFGAEWIKGNPTIVEYVTFERPRAWTSVARSRRLDANAEGRISPTERGSQVVIRTELRPKGFLALLLPLMRRTMHAREDENLERVKAILERKES